MSTNLKFRSSEDTSKHPMMFLFWATVGIVLLVLATTLLTITRFSQFYPEKELVSSFLPTDCVILFVGVPFFVLILSQVWQRKTIGLQLWPAILFLLIYIYFPYIFSIPFSLLFLPHLLIVTLSWVVLVGVLTQLNIIFTFVALGDKKNYSLITILLIIFSTLIILRQGGVVLSAYISKSIVDFSELIVIVIDFLMMLPALLYAAYLLVMKRISSIFIIPSILFAYGFLSMSLLPWFVVQSFLFYQPLDWGGVIVIAVMTLLCFFGLIYYITNSNKIGKNQSGEIN